MKLYEQVIKLTEDDKVELSQQFKELLHTHLVLGQTRHLCRYGTLSDGHEKITPSQRYYQAIKEMYYLSNNIQGQRAIAMDAQAELLDAQEALSKADKQSDKLRAEAKLLRAETSLKGALITVEDQLRMVDEYNKIRLELKHEVETKYPHGIEQAERDNWLAVAEYRMIKERVPGVARERLDNLPLDPITKAKLGLIYGREDAVAPLMITNKEALAALPTSDNSAARFISAIEHKESSHA